MRRYRWVVDAALVVSAAVLGWRLVGAIPVPQPVRTSIERGASLNVPGVDWAKAETNVVLVTSSICPASRSNLALYKEIGRRTRAAGRSQFVVVSTEPVRQIHSWLSAAGVSDYVAVRSYDAPALGLVLSPMLLTVKASGTVTNVISGAVSESAYEATIDQLLR